MENIFVFVVCGAKEHTDTLHYSLQSLRKFSSSKVIVLTDSSRNEEKILHNCIIDVKTPTDLNHHQASIYLKTSIHRYVPKGNVYCYLDTDVIAVSDKVDDIFKEYAPPVIFGHDHCEMDRFSPTAMNCGCSGQPDKGAELRALFKKYKHLTRQAEDLEKKERLLKKLEAIKKNNFYYAWISLKFNLSRQKFRLDDDNFLDKEKQFWHDRKGNAVLYEREDNAIIEIERTSDFRCDVSKNHYWTYHGKAVFDCRCNHLAQAIEKKFDVIVSDFQWQHWNGGVFLFGETGYDFLDAWHKKTMQIFKDKAWRTRDQGTLIATVWEAELQNHTVLSKRFNLIADYNHESLHHKGNLIFETTEPNEIIAPELIHVYHHWADESWDVWKEIEKRTGLIANKESNIINLLFLKNELNLVELLTINSFVKQGHTVKLWTYSTLKNKLPESVLVGDAALIIPINGYSFLNQNNTKFKHKIDLFTNAFCYKLLYEYGGWWVNSDVTCLKHLDFDKSYFFTENYESQISDSVIKSPKGSMLMNLCYKEALDLLSEGQHIEYKSLNILDRNVRKLQLNNYIVKDVTGNQTIKQTIQLVIGNEYVPDYWYFINWQTKNWSTEKLNTQSFYFNSSLYEFLCNHGIAQPPSSIWQQWVNEFQFSSPVRTLKRMLVV